MNVVVEGVQSMPPQNMPFWHKDSFEQKATEKKQTQQTLSVLHLSTKKNRKMLNHWRQL